MKKIALITVAWLIAAFQISAVKAGTVVQGRVTMGGTNYNADWYLPDAKAKGLVYLQHGFARNSGNLRNLGTAMMDSGLMVLSVNANMAGGNAALAGAAAEMLADSSATPPNNIALPDNVVLAGHSAGGLHVSLVGKAMVDAGANNFMGTILFDAVDAGNLMGSAMQATVNAGKPVYSLVARGGLCNNNANSEPLLKALTGTDFVGLKLTSLSTHIDSEGTDAGFFARLFCGVPRPYNIEYAQQFGAAWATDLLTGSVSSDYYPGGAMVEAVINRRHGNLLK